MRDLPTPDECNVAAIIARDYFKHGREHERERIVAWLRRSKMADVIADAIEAGAHEKASADEKGGGK